VCLIGARGQAISTGNGCADHGLSWYVSGKQYLKGFPKHGLSWHMAGQEVQERGVPVGLQGL
jgi:hypothetical protein